MRKERKNQKHNHMASLSSDLWIGISLGWSYLLNLYLQTLMDLYLNYVIQCIVDLHLLKIMYVMFSFE